MVWCGTPLTEIDRSAGPPSDGSSVCDLVVRRPGRPRRSASRAAACRDHASAQARRAARQRSHRSEHARTPTATSDAPHHRRRPRNDSSGERARCRSASRSGPSGRRSAARSSAKHRPTTSAGPASAAATSTKMIGSTSQAGGPVVLQRGEVDDVAARPGRWSPGTPGRDDHQHGQEHRRPAAAPTSVLRVIRKPSPMPRNEPSSTKLEK